MRTVRSHDQDEAAHKPPRRRGAEILPAGWGTVGEFVPGVGGEWWTLLCDSGRKRFTEEVSALRSTCSGNEWPLLVADLSRLLEDAEGGLLVFDTTNTRGEVCRPRGFKNCEDDKPRLDVQEVLELRIERTFNLDDRRRHLRLYYSEPK